MLHIPLLRHGKPYRSLDVVRAPHYRTREPFVEISQANVGLIRRDLLQQSAAREKLAGYSTEQLLRICADAAEYFLHSDLAVGEMPQSPDDYIGQVSATTGLPHTLARNNMRKIYKMMAEMRTVLRGLTRNLDFAVLDRGFGEADGQELSFFPRGNSLGVVLPSNSPGVHSLWIPAFALKVPLVLKPGGAEPWTPYRIIQALIRAGAPPEAFCYYPADHAGGGEILRRCERGMVFGDTSSTKLWRNDSRIEVHGPGYSKVVIGRDAIGDWEKYLDVMAASIAENSGRSCINASGVWVPAHSGEIAEALAERLARVVPRDAGDPEAQLAPFADASVAERTSDIIDSQLEGARDVSAERRGTARLAMHDGSAYLLPTIIHPPSPQHSLANREFLFPFASVVEVDEADIPGALGPSLVVTAITRNRGLIDRLLGSPHVGRLNIGAIPTNHIQWDQPHEGNLFDHLYARRAFQRDFEAMAS
jgi:acyl-CoA reductase-like NAD-dependent aldehyde dehydrogenase